MVDLQLMIVVNKGWLSKVGNNNGEPMLVKTSVNNGE